MAREGATSERLAELAENLSAVRAQVAAAAESAGRDLTELTVIAITKFFPATDAAALAELGLADLGESRDQEASVKSAEVSALTTAPVRWHYVGRLQTNKARSVARYADVVHSVDRAALVDALAAGVLAAGRPPLRVLIQVSLDGDLERGGVPVAEVDGLARMIAGQPMLSLAGVMAVAPLTADPDSAFAELADVSAQLRAEHLAATSVSAGMSGDFAEAVRHGATHLRIGTALLGRRGASFS